MPPWDSLLAYPESRHSSIRVSAKWGAAGGPPSLAHDSLEAGFTRKKPHSGNFNSRRVNFYYRGNLIWHRGDAVCHRG